MESVERAVRSWMLFEKDTEVNQLVTGISSGQVALLDIVKALGEYLTSAEDALRTKGVRFLSLVIEQCPKDKLNRQTVRVLATFYCSKLEDTETITPALKGLSYLVSFPSFSSNEVSDVLSAIFLHVNMKALVQSTRFFVFNIIYSLMSSHRDDLKRMGDQFLSSYAALASGEKDPRNLLVAFKIARVVLAEFDTSKHVEDYFEVTFCYFPITFRPPPNDPYGISADDLKDSLRLCLSASPAFGSLGIPLFLEKLTAGSPTTKRDTLQAMSACFPVYGSTVAREFGQKVWSALKLEIFQPIDPLTEQTALDTLREFVRILQPISTPTDGLGDDIDTLVRTICNDCIEAIGEPEKAQAKAGMKALCTFVGISPDLSFYAVTAAADKLVKLFHDPGEVSNRAAVIVLLTDLLNTLVLHNNTSEPSMLHKRPLSTGPTSLSSLGPSPLESAKDALLGLLVVGLKSSSTRLPAIHGLSALIRIPSVVTDEELGYIVLEAGEFVGKEPDEVEDVTTDVLSLLSSISIIAPHHLATQILPPLFAALPDRAPSRDAQSERAAYWRALCASSTLCVQPTLFETLVIRLTAKLDLLCTPSPSMSASSCVPSTPTAEVEEAEGTAAYAHAILTALADALFTKVSKPELASDVPKYVDHLLPHLFRLFLEAAITSEQCIMTDPRLLHVGARIIKLVVQTLSIEQQRKFVGETVAAFLNGEVKSVTGGEFSSLTQEFRPLRTDASTRQRDTVTLLAAAHVPIRKEVTVILKGRDGSNASGPISLSALLKDLVKWCDLPTCSAHQREVACELFATLVNKHTDDVSDFLDDMLKGYWSTTLNNPNVSSEVRNNAIKIWIWITKGLVVRSHQLASSFVDRLFILLDDGAVDWSAARALGALAEDDHVLTKRNGAVLKILHVQKYFDAVLPRTQEGAKKIDGSRRETAYLIALAYLVNAVPKAMYTTQMPTLMPLLLRGLDVADPAIRSHIIDSLSNNIAAASDDQTSLSAYASTLVLAMLKNCMVADMPDHRVRVAALKYLALLPGAIRYDLLHPYKSGVLRDLAKALDDPKRAVRKEAVNARTNWYRYSG
ncbi:ARM repeat-containing protein [Paxillus ammoniavirescens]|nr:ARM repeat-containing protein [Paxillus ammoniavirescens]